MAKANPLPPWLQRALFTAAKGAYRLSTRRSLPEDLRDLDRVPALEKLAFLNESRVRSLGAAVRIGASGRSFEAAERRADGWMHDEVFVLGSGASLLRLSPAERGAIAAGASFAMNKYLLYWDLVGIWPTYTSLADIHFPTHRVLAQMLDVVAAESSRSVPRFVLTSDYEPWGLDPIRPIYFKRPHKEGQHPWAESADEPMFFHRGSLSCVLNWVTAFRVAPKVTLLGVDLSSGAAFYEERFKRDTHLHDHWEAVRGKTGAHPTAVVHNSVPPIQAVLPDVFAKMAQRGVAVRCYNSDSLLIQEGLCPLRERLG